MIMNLALKINSYYMQPLNKRVEKRMKIEKKKGIKNINIRKKVGLIVILIKKKKKKVSFKKQKGWK